MRRRGRGGGWAGSERWRRASGRGCRRSMTLGGDLHLPRVYSSNSFHLWLCLNFFFFSFLYFNPSHTLVVIYTAPASVQSHLAPEAEQ